MPRRAHIHLPHVPQNPTEGPWLLLKWLIPLFSVVFIINGIMVYKAQKTFSGVTTDHAYEQGLAYNQTLAQRAQQAKLNWSFSTTMQNGQFEVMGKDAAGQPLTGATIVAAFQRPATIMADTHKPLQETTPGTYSVPTVGLAKGAWNVILNVTRPNTTGGKDTFTMETRLDVTP